MRCVYAEPGMRGRLVYSGMLCGVKDNGVVKLIQRERKETQSGECEAVRATS